MCHCDSPCARNCAQVWLWCVIVAVCGSDPVVGQVIVGTHTTSRCVCWGVTVLLWLCYLRAASDGGFMNVSGTKCTGCLWLCKDVWVWSLKFLWHRVCGWKVPVTVPSWRCVCPSGWCVRSGQILVLSSRLFPFCDQECSEQPPLLWTLSFPPSHG